MTGSNALSADPRKKSRTIQNAEKKKQLNL